MQRKQYVRRPVRIAVLCVLTTFLGFSATTYAQSSGDSTSTVVYVESNLPDHNSVLAFKRNNDGTLTQIGDFSTGGRGVFDLSLQLGPFDSDQEIITNGQHNLLFAVNPGSDTVAVFRIQVDGALTPVHGSPFPSGGSNPVSLGLAADKLIVVNKAFDPARPFLKNPSYTAFQIGPNGQLTQQLSAVGAPRGSAPSQADISPDKRLVFDAQFLAGFLRTFFLQPDGTLSLGERMAPPIAAGSTTQPLPLGLWSHPKLPILYVGLVNVNMLGVYQYANTGHLQFVTAVPDSGNGICWIRTSDDGTRLYASNTGDRSISVFDTTSHLTHVEIQHFVLQGQGNQFEIELDPTGAFLYAVSQRASASTPLGQGNTLHVLTIDRVTGFVAEPNTPVNLAVPNGVRPQGLAAVQLLAN
jgi:6-phosphogluconolactonase (cycloisomerase 2 family)